MPSPGTTSDTAATSRPRVGTGAGLLMLSLGQINLFFVIWLTIWPDAFGVPSNLALMAGFSGFFTATAILSFYLGFSTLERSERGTTTQ